MVMKTIPFLFPLIAALPLLTMAYEESMDRTEKNIIEVKVIPEVTALQAVSENSYFDADNGLFRKLFRYISDKDIAMTTPVTVDVDPGAMRFLVAADDLPKADENTAAVQVVTLPERTVVSIGYNGRYNRKNYDKHLKKLQAWLEANQAEWQADGEPVAVYWDGPFKLAAWKKAEVMIPVRKTRTAE